ncbi:hypothetical protein SGRIM119S_02885 [Streptomyces griseorubiginosus]
MTQAGQVYVACARRVLRAVQEMHAEISSLDGPVRGRLRIGSVTLTAGNIDQLGLLREFQEVYPAVEVTLFDSDGVRATSSSSPVNWRSPSSPCTSTSCPRASPTTC